MRGAGVSAHRRRAATFWPVSAAAVERLEARGELARRRGLLHHKGKESPHRSVDIRTARAAHQFAIVIQETGELLGTADESRAYYHVHPGAVYLHQGEQFEVTELDLVRAWRWSTRAIRTSTRNRATRPTSMSSRPTSDDRRRVPTFYGTVRVPTRSWASCARWLAPARSWTMSRSRCRRRRSRRRPSGGRSRNASSTGGDQSLAQLPGRGRTPPSTPRSACSRSSRRATGGTSAACPRRTTRTPILRDLHLRRLRGRRRHRRARIPLDGAAARGHARDRAQLRVHPRVPVVRPVPEVRQRERAARQAWGGRPAVGDARAGVGMSRVGLAHAGAYIAVVGPPPVPRRSTRWPTRSASSSPGAGAVLVCGGWAA